MRRAGWKVWVADELDGSYEQVPPNLLAELQRDRRWCHGNLQNSRLMFEPGLHAVHRTAFLTGVLAYASSPLWLAFLLLSTLLFAQPRRRRPDLLLRAVPAVPDLADRQPQADADAVRPHRACCCSRPRCCRWWRSSCRGEARRFGGARRLIGSAFIEFAALAAARAGADAVPHPVRARRADRLAARLEVAAARRRRHRLARGGLRATACTPLLAVALDRRHRRQQRSLPVVAVADPRSACCSAMPLSVWGSRVADRPGAAPARPAADAGRDAASRACLREARRAGRRWSPHGWRRSGGGRRPATSTRASSPRCRSVPRRRRQGRAPRRRCIERALREGPEALVDRRALAPALEPRGAARCCSAEVVAQRAHPTGAGVRGRRRGRRLRRCRRHRRARDRDASCRGRPRPSAL